jgi:hypothetical protein
MSPANRPETKLHLLPKIPPELVPAILVEIADLSAPEDMDVESIDRYRPWDSVSARLEQNRQGQPVLIIEDNFLPPAQTGEAKPVNNAKLEPGYSLRQFGPEHATPSMVLFEDTEKYRDKDKPNSDRQKWVKSWQSRMGVARTSGPYTRPTIHLMKTDGDRVTRGQEFITFPNVHYDSATSHPYGLASKSELKEMGYASVLLYRHLEQFFPELEPGDYIYVQSVSGKEGDYQNFFIVEKRDKGFNIKISAEELLAAICRDTSISLGGIEARAWADYANAEQTGGKTKMYLREVRGKDKIGWSHLSQEGEFTVQKIIENYTDLSWEDVVQQLTCVRVNFAHPADSVEKRSQ